MISNALRLIRVFHDMKQIELAKKLGVSKSYLSEIEAGQKAPTLPLIEKYAKLFEIPASAILFFAENLRDPSARSQARRFVAKKVLTLLQFIEQRSGASGGKGKNRLLV
jgi:transcriptional regulator with XRE-family HTH domain